MYQQPNLISNQTALAFLPKLQQFRAAGQIEEYKYDSIKPKKKLKEITKVLMPEKKKILFVKYGYKFNLKDRCVVCGMHHVWEAGDFLRPPIPLDRVEKGRPLRGTYCPKHASVHKQMEMLQQQILADKHGLEFSAFKPRMPKMLKSGPIKNLSKEDVMSLTSAGWFITPPALGDSKTATDEVIRLITEINIMTERLNHLMLKHNVQAQNELPQEEAKEELVKEA